MGILDGFEKVEKKIQKFVEEKFGREAAMPPLKLRREILKELEDRIQPLGGKRVFPFNRLDIRIYADDSESRAIRQMAFLDNRQLESDILEMLKSSGSDLPEQPQIEVSIVASLPPERADHGFSIQYERRSQSSEIPSARLVPLRGKTKDADYTIGKSQTYIGRLTDIFDEYGRLQRRNDIVFLDTDDEINATVARVHAHISYQEKSGDFLLHDDRSANGTRVLRDGRVLEVPIGKRGIKLRSGDEIHLGQASLKFEVG